MPEGTDANRAAGPLSLFLVSHSYPPVLGGSEIEAQRVCAALVRRGHNVTVLCAGGPPMPPIARWTDPFGVPVRILTRRSRGRFRDWVFAVSVAWTLFRERRNYRLVYFLMQGAHLATGLPMARWLGKPIVMKISGSSLATLMRASWLGRLELGWLNRWARRVMVLNPGIAQEAVEAGIHRERLFWMPNPIDTEEFAPCAPEARQAIRERFGIPAGAKAVLYVGRLAPEKELPSLLGAFATVAARLPEALLIFIGDGPCRQELETLTAKLGMEKRVRFAGRRPGEEICQWLQASDLFTLVSSNEGFPCSLSEAMACAIPSVVTDIPGSAQLIDDGAQGHVVPVKDEARLAEAIAGLLENPERRARMGEAARRRIVENYSTAKVLDRYERLFEDCRE